MFNTRNDSPLAGTEFASQNAQFRPGNVSSSSYNFGAPNSAMASSDTQQQGGPQFAPSFLFGNQQPSNRRSFATPTRHVIPGLKTFAKYSDLNFGKFVEVENDIINLTSDLSFQTILNAFS